MQVIGVMAQMAAAAQAAKAHRAAGDAEARALEDKRDSAASAAKDRELERLVKLRKIRSSQAAYWSASGIDLGTGTPVVIADRTYDVFQMDQGADLINTRHQIRSYNNAAMSARKIGNIKARSSILSGVMGAAQNISDSASTWNT
tara:strand:- start:2150 stop:2584 length:435 start_codon:yes stop_codon:yes gene_type:complete